MEENKRIGLALSGGGIKGIAHIGVMKALEELDIRPNIISGVSAGAIIGCLFAAGLDADSVKKFVDQTKFGKAFFPGFTTKGLLKHDFLKTRLKEYLSFEYLEDLTIPFKVACTNLNTGQIEVFDEGPIIPAVAASSAIPVLFSPEKIGDNLYSDGGVLMNLPAETIREHCDVLIGVDLIPRVEIKLKQLSGVFSSMSIAARTFYLTIQNNSAKDIALCDILIVPEHIEDHHIFSFNKVEEIFESGYTSTMKQKDQILAQLERTISK